MPRMRMIKPEFFEDALMAQLTPVQRLIYIGLWVQCCDDYGAFLWSERAVFGAIFPLDGDDAASQRDIRETLASLSRLGRIVRFEADGQAFGQVLSWERHQKVDKPSKKRYPAYCGPSRDPRESLASHSRDPRAQPESESESESEPTYIPPPAPPEDEPRGTALFQEEQPATEKAHVQEARKALAHWNARKGTTSRWDTWKSSLTAAVKAHGLEAVCKVIDWRFDSMHPRAVHLRDGGHELETILRPKKLEAYKGFMLAEAAPAKSKTNGTRTRLIVKAGEWGTCYKLDAEPDGSFKLPDGYEWADG